MSQPFYFERVIKDLRSGEYLTGKDGFCFIDTRGSVVSFYSERQSKGMNFG